MCLESSRHSLACPFAASTVSTFLNPPAGSGSLKEDKAPLYNISTSRSLWMQACQERECILIPDVSSAGIPLLRKEPIDSVRVTIRPLNRPCSIRLPTKSLFHIFEIQCSMIKDLLQCKFLYASKDSHSKSHNIHLERSNLLAFLQHT